MYIDPTFESPALLHSLFTYDEKTGRLRHKHDKGRVKAGDYADTYTRNGYRRSTVKVNGKRKQVASHRIIWVLNNGPVPDGCLIDHANSVRDDNRIENLRAVTVAENAHNLRHAKGYHYNKTHRKWQARICVDGYQLHIGYYPTPEEARAAYMAKKRELHPTSPIQN